MLNDNILRGYISQEKAYDVQDYPYSFKLRTKIYYWIESKKGKGDRFCYYTINPKNGKANKPNRSTYNTFMYMYLNEQGHVTTGVITPYNIKEFEARFDFIRKRIGIEFVNEIQQENIRKAYLTHETINHAYTKEEYQGEQKESFLDWSGEKLKHIQTCDFKDLVSFPEWENKVSIDIITAL